MKTLIYILAICLLLISCNSNYFNKKITISIKSVQIETTKPDIETSELSIFINFTNYGTSIDRWQLGFYMPSKFYKLVNDNLSYNPKLRMEICDNQNNCTQLFYKKAETILENDLSQGYTTILAPVTLFPLLKGNSYKVQLLHNNEWGLGNISNFPQNFFFILSDQSDTTEMNKVYNVTTNKDIYTIINYDQKNIDSIINQHIQNNWLNSIPFNRSLQDNKIVPSPVRVHQVIGYNYTIQNGIIIHNQLNNNNQLAIMIAEALQKDININANIDNQEDAVSGIIIQRLIDKAAIQNNPEGYILTINSNNIVIQAINNAGVYYAFQTLRQLWNGTSNKNGVILPQLSIIDYPRFKYRGVLLDTVRHFFTVSEIKSLIDLMGSNKLNTLHLHLSDDEAFRLALPSYPTLQSIGSVRGFGLLMGPMMFPQGNLYQSLNKSNNNLNTIYTSADTIYGGIYSISDIASIIAYANAHQITVIPEIDLPSHSRALIKSLPEALIDLNDKSQFISAQGYTDNVLPVCTYNTNISVGPTFTRTINTIVNIIANLFNKQTTVYAINNEVSIGGDEVSPNAWTNNSSCQGIWYSLSALQKSHKFFQLMAKVNPDVILSGWQQFIQTDDIALGNTIVPTNRAGHVWVWNTTKLGIPQASTLANHGYQTVLAFADKTYFDLAYTPDIHELGFNWASQYSDTQSALSSALSATDTINATNFLAQGNVVGIEAALWSENLDTYQKMIYMALPKMAGLSEASWSPSTVTHNGTQVNWQSLADRLGCGQSGFLAYLTRLYGVHYRGYPNGIMLEVPMNFCN